MSKIMPFELIFFVTEPLSEELPPADVEPRDERRANKVRYRVTKMQASLFPAAGWAKGQIGQWITR